MENNSRRYLEPADLKPRYLGPERTEEQKLAIETCPGYNSALNRALNDYYEETRCQDCRLVTAEIFAMTGAVNIRGNCPKV